ncbi:efflux transporter, RND family, MFP subunit domain protein [Delftia acidovorans]|nr:efflux transporter, RND family, MFP subunit domain protein [Delftia acidovorans]
MANHMADPMTDHMACTSAIPCWRLHGLWAGC